MLKEKLLDSIPYDIDSYAVYAENEIKDTFNGRFDFKLFYTTGICQLSGVFDINTIKSNLEDYTKAHKQLRSLYFLNDDKSITQVVTTNLRPFFKVNDISTISTEKQNAYINSIVRAQTRLGYNPEESCPFRFQCFITDWDKMLVVYSYCPIYKKPFDMQDFISCVFNEQTIKTQILLRNSDNYVEVIDPILKEKSINYWKDMFSTLPVKEDIPYATGFNGHSNEYSSVIRDISGKSYEYLKTFLHNTNIKLEDIITLVIGDYISVHNESDCSIVSLRQNGQHMNLMPVVVKKMNDFNTAIKAIQSQHDSFYTYSACKLYDVINLFESEYSHLFNLIIDVRELSENESNTGIVSSLAGLEPLNPDVFIKFTDDAKHLSVEYNFAPDVFIEELIDSFHKDLVSLIDAYVSGKYEGIEFDWHRYIESSKSPIERTVKLMQAQKVLYLNNNNLIAEDDNQKGLSISGEAYVMSYLDKDIVLEVGKRINKIGLIVDGRIEEEYLGESCMAKTVAIRKPGYIIGLEAFEDNVISKYSYIAFNGASVLP